MISLLNYIVEYKGHAIRDKEKSIGDPDEIKHYFDSGWVHLKFNKDNAYPYVYNKKLNKIIFGKPNSIHNNIFTSENEKELKEIGLENITKIGQIRYCCGEDDDTEEIDKWYEENKQYVDNTICGRLWYDAQDDFESWGSEEQAEQMAAIFGKLKNFDSCKCYVVNWNEIEPNEFQQINDAIVELFAKEHNIKIKSYIAIDNNGEPIEMFVGENTKVEKRSIEREKEISNLMNIHNPQHGESWEEFRKRKHEATKGYNKSRGKHFQRDYYNQTKSKTAAEWHNNKTKRYNSQTGKMEWGKKIGDSLEMKTIKNYILESTSETDTFTLHFTKEEMKLLYSKIKATCESSMSIRQKIETLCKENHINAK